MQVKFSGAIYNCSGYAQLRKLFLNLANRGNKVKLVPFNSLDHVNFLDLENYKKLEDTKLKKNYIAITAGIAPQIKPDPEAAYNIAYSMFETLNIPEKWIDNYNEFDEIWTPSNFCKKAFNVKEMKPIITVIPIGVDTNVFIPKARRGIFTFLGVGTWLDRKGWDVLIKAYTSEFIGNFNVRLCIKTFNDLKTKEELIKEHLTEDKSALLPRIMVNNIKIDENLMPMIYQESDCYILPSRGEALGLPYLEAMSCGLPVIASKFGGHTDFINNENGWLIDIKTLKHLSARLCKINTCYDGLWFAEPDVDDVRKIMKYIFLNKEEVIEKGKKARETIISKYDWEKVTDRAENRLKEIEELIK